MSTRIDNHPAPPKVETKSAAPGNKSDNKTADKPADAPAIQKALLANTFQAHGPEAALRTLQGNPVSTVGTLPSGAGLAAFRMVAGIPMNLAAMSAKADGAAPTDQASGAGPTDQTAQTAQQAQADVAELQKQKGGGGLAPSDVAGLIAARPNDPEYAAQVMGAVYNSSDGAAFSGFNPANGVSQDQA